jgi:hypothetical protein
MPVVVAGVALTALAVPGDGWASLPHPVVVSENPSDASPHVVADATVTRPYVDAYVQAGDTMYAGGVFRSVANASRTETYSRTYVFSFDAASGAVTPFAPVIDGRVHALDYADGSLYVGGVFENVNGVARRGLVKIDAATGTVDTTFNASFPSGKVNDLEIVGGRLLVAGSFPKKLLALDLSTGADTGYINLGITGRLEGTKGTPYLQGFAVNEQGTQLAAVGNFTTVSGKIRHRAFLVDLESGSARLNPWYYNPLTRPCGSTEAYRQAYLTDVDFSPDGSYFVVVSTGHIPRTGDLFETICDAAARFNVDNPTPQVPRWINYTGGDTIYSVAVTGAAVYVQGHFDYLDNPYGNNSAGEGAVARRGVGAIDPQEGTALPWNPHAPARIGGQVLYTTPNGMWFGSDGKYWGGEYHRGIVFAPLP